MAISLGLACSGCSFVFTRGPNVEPEKITADTKVECSTSSAPAVIDAVLTTTHLGGAVLAGLVLTDQDFGGSTGRTAAIAADLSLAALHAASAIYGGVTVDSCQKAQGRAKELAAERQRKSPGWKPQKISEPSGAAAFRFGMSHDAAERVCIGTGHSFRAGDGYSACDGAPSGFTQAKSVELKFDNRGLWSIDVVIPPGEEWQGTLGQLRAAMIERYGDPARTDHEIPERCGVAAEAAGCAERGEMKVATEWQWPNGARVVLRVPPVSGPLTIKLLYVLPPSTAPRATGAITN